MFFWIRFLIGALIKTQRAFDRLRVCTSVCTSVCASVCASVCVCAFLSEETVRNTHTCTPSCTRVAALKRSEFPLMTVKFKSWTLCSFQAAAKTGSFPPHVHTLTCTRSSGLHSVTWCSRHSRRRLALRPVTCWEVEWIWIHSNRILQPSRNKEPPPRSPKPAPEPLTTRPRQNLSAQKQLHRETNQLTSCRDLEVLEFSCV